MCLPATNCSWIGKAHLFRQQVERTELQVGSGRPWTLLTATPASCVNIGLHNVYRDEPIDLVLSGPNLGRNSGRSVLAQGASPARHHSPQKR